MQLRAARILDLSGSCYWEHWEGLGALLRALEVLGAHWELLLGALGGLGRCCSEHPRHWT